MAPRGDSHPGASSERTAVGRPDFPHVTVVGGGIAGLYAAYLLGRKGHTVELYEFNRALGGRIATREWLSEKAAKPLRAEFGPMRFELDLQRRLLRLGDALGVEFDDFTPTMSPRTPNDYDMTAVERAFDSAADLHKWAVLKMFYGRVPQVLDALEDIESHVFGVNESGGAARGALDRDGLKWTAVGQLQLHYLQCYLDRQIFCGTRDGKIEPRDETARDQALDRLRLEQRLGGDNQDKDWPLLQCIGLWHGLSEVITPGALARIRDSGTFYHFISQNPNAAEWGIFWLRQASILGDLWTIKGENGVFSIVTRLAAKIKADAPSVRIKTGFEVVGVEPAKRPSEVVLRIHELAKNGRVQHAFSVRTDHVILALPQRPLKLLSAHFPENVVNRIDGVEPVRLLKAFVVTTKPWWRPQQPAQSYAWNVPTRELHFFHDKDDDSSAQSDNGMIMLYTDEPSIEYWDLLIPASRRKAVYWRVFSESDTARREVDEFRSGLLAMLIRRLLVLPHPGLPVRLNRMFGEFESNLQCLGPHGSPRR